MDLLPRRPLKDIIQLFFPLFFSPNIAIPLIVLYDVIVDAEQLFHRQNVAVGQRLFLDS